MRTRCPARARVTGRRAARRLGASRGHRGFARPTRSGADGAAFHVPRDAGLGASPHEVGKARPFVAAPPYSRHACVGATADMKHNARPPCHAHAHEIFDGVAVRCVCVGVHHIIGNPEVVGNLKIVCFTTGVDDGTAPVEAAPQLPTPCTRRPSRCRCPQGSFVRGAREVAGEVGPTQATPDSRSDSSAAREMVAPSSAPATAPPSGKRGLAGAGNLSRRSTRPNLRAKRGWSMGAFPRRARAAASLRRSLEGRRPRSGWRRYRPLSAAPSHRHPSETSRSLSAASRV